MQRKSTLGRLRTGMLAILGGGIPLVTLASCDPRSGYFDLYRNVGSNDGYFLDVFYDDCWYDCGYYYDDYYYDDYYYFD